ncbi:MAG TPA: hypothetical protein VFA39_19990 [Steroidobacteraceae bacterium]|nr:hypothetical protein [Steroidobacteraceae bacterium]
MKHKVLKQTPADAPLAIFGDQEKAREALLQSGELEATREYTGVRKSTLLEQARADLQQSGDREISAEGGVPT